MMASIPNMRSAPLPVPAAAAGATGEAAPGDFAAQMPVPAPPVQPVEAVPPVPMTPVALDLDSLPPIDGAAEGESNENAEAKSDAPTGEQPAPAAVVIPFLPVQPANSRPQVQPTVSADDAAPRNTPVESTAARPGRPAREAKPGKVVLAPPANSDSPAEPAAPQADTALIEAAVKELLQRKQGPSQPVAAAPKTAPFGPAKTDPAPVQAQPKAPAKTAPASVDAAILPSPLSAAEPVQPALAPSMPQPALMKAEATGTVEGTRTTDLAVERQLDLARDTEWLDRLARDIARAGAADAPLRFRLHPQTLGHLQVELQRGDHGTAVRLTVETEAARQILADAQPRLAAEARAQGVRIAETHVDLTGSGRHAPGDQRRQDEARQNPLIRTARGAGSEPVGSARLSSRARLDRYA